MATLDHPANSHVSQVQAVGRRDYPAGGVRFDLALALLIGWFVGGLFLDGWAHNNGRVDDSFFTPWHAVLYSGFASAAGLLVVTHFRNVGKGYSWLRALPRGYMLSLLGVVIFGVGGLADLAWHEIFGIEQNMEALLSPSHLMLAVGGFMVIIGPLRAAWMRRQANGWRTMLPVVLALLYTLSLLTFFTQYAHFFTRPEALHLRVSSNDSLTDVFAIATLLIPTALMLGVILFALRRWTLPTGSLTVIFAVNMTLMFAMFQRHSEDYPLLLLVGPLAGLFADALLGFLKPGIARPNALRLFAFLTPFVLVLLHLFLVNASVEHGLRWEIHMWLGVPFVAGIIGLFLGFLVCPPALPAEA